ncbi:MAG: transketolase [Bacteroidetes bacterium RBG_13_42_15]|nr:MAG: transketolase [Bacteroidetes bacterium RBG_13_42_15]
MNTEYKELERKAVEIRKKLLQMIFNAKSGHTGGALSSVDILTTLFFHTMNYHSDKPGWSDRDRFILSKGHSVEGYYCVLAEAGFFPKEVLDTYGKFQSILAGHPTRKVPGVELNSGALGHGLSVGVGMALAAKMDHKKNRVFVLMGDGEQGEGSVMEAANSAGHNRLDNLTAIIDRNFLQISGHTESVMSLESLSSRWKAYHWHVDEANGNNIEELAGLLDTYPVETGKPHLVIAYTIKGRGVSFIENRAEWHHKVPSAEQMEQAIEELNKMLK